eukprot:scaffold988_cov105-Isochrysis_galbana.AAC.5
MALTAGLHATWPRWLVTSDGATPSTCDSAAHAAAGGADGGEHTSSSPRPSCRRPTEPLAPAASLGATPGCMAASIRQMSRPASARTGSGAVTRQRHAACRTCARSSARGGGRAVPPFCPANPPAGRAGRAGLVPAGAVRGSAGAASDTRE